MLSAQVSNSLQVLVLKHNLHFIMLS